MPLLGPARQVHTSSSSSVLFGVHYVQVSAAWKRPKQALVNVPGSARRETFCIYIYMCLCLACVSAFWRLCAFASLCPCVCVFVFACLRVSTCICTHVSLSLSLPLSLSLCLCMCAFLRLFVSVSLSRSNAYESINKGLVPRGSRLEDTHPMLFCQVNESGVIAVGPPRTCSEWAGSSSAT